MSYPTFRAYFRIYIRSIYTSVPWAHWGILSCLSLVLIVFLLIRKNSVYASFSLGITVLLGLYLVDATVFARLGENIPQCSRIDIMEEYHRLFHGNEVQRVQILLNLLAFIPFGFFFSDFLALEKLIILRRRIIYVALAGFGLSLCIEYSQSVLRVGLFEVTDLFMNTMGAFIGATFSVLIRVLIGKSRKQTTP